MNERYFSCADIAEMTKKSRRTVWEWCRTGKLKATKPSGRDYIIKESDWLRFVNGENQSA